MQHTPFPLLHPQCKGTNTSFIWKQHNHFRFQPLLHISTVSQAALPSKPQVLNAVNTRKAVPHVHCTKPPCWKAASAFLLPFHSFPWFALPFRSQAFQAALKLFQASVDSSWERSGSGICYALSSSCSPFRGWVFTILYTRWTLETHFCSS